jgi:hydrogenase small subunit
LLNRVAPTAPTNGADLLINTINLAYHPNLMAAAGDTAVGVAREVYGAGGYVLAVEGGIPTAFGGNACWAWTENGHDVTFADAVTSLASRAAAVLSVGTCAAWGGIAAAYPNPTGVKSVSTVLGKATVNIPGCPPHPDWMVWTIAKLLTGSLGSLDEYGRPTGLFPKKVHDVCPRKGKGEITTYGVDGKCMKTLGCQGPKTLANCPTLQWNNGANWCVDANNPCIGCTNPTFPASTLRKEAQ